MSTEAGTTEQQQLLNVQHEIDFAMFFELLVEAIRLQAEMDPPTEVVDTEAADLIAYTRKALETPIRQGGG